MAQKKNLRRLMLCAVLTAMSVVLAMIAKQIFTNNSFFRITFENLFREQMFLKFDVRLPEGWTAAYAKAQQLQYETRYSTEFTTWEMTLTAGETVAARNDILVFVTADSHPMPLTVPVVLLG